jgi:NAD(P)H dehydrogenase (quinone)
MNVLVLYHSRTGRTKELAMAIARGAESVRDTEVSVRSVSDVVRKDFVSADAVIAGSPVYFGTMSGELKAVFDRFIGTRRKMENKIGAAFATSGFHTGGKETTLMSIIQAFLIYGMIVVGDPIAASGHYGVAFSGEIDDEIRDHGAKLGARVASLAAALSSKHQERLVGRSGPRDGTG